ncbi:unnamed protein product [Vicia faba]|uniref:Uncharacterized protein n=1 Tax=Vicia faba TaxID=3906 RepID=A0AAV1B6M6_VICFA|nr:unnamed protein product [Vicia faba]
MAEMEFKFFGTASSTVNRRGKNNSENPALVFFCFIAGECEKVMLMVLSLTASSMFVTADLMLLTSLMILTSSSLVQNWLQDIDWWLLEEETEGCCYAKGGQLK